jgi:hypothetical protein
VPTTKTYQFEIFVILMNLLKILLLKTAVGMLKRRAIPKIGSFIDIVLSYDNQEFRTNFRLSRGISSFKNI